MVSGCELKGVQMWVKYLPTYMQVSPNTPFVVAYTIVRRRVITVEIRGRRVSGVTSVAVTVQHPCPRTDNPTKAKQK